MIRRLSARSTSVRVLLAVLAVAGGVRAQQFYSELRSPVQDQPSALVIGDLDGDTFPDAVAVGSPFFSGTGFVSILLNDGSGRFLPMTSMGSLGGVVDAALGDVTGDGRLDLVEAIASPPRLWLFPGDGAGGFGAPTGHPIPVTAPLLFVRAVALGDVNGDTWLDAVSLNTANTGDQGLSVFLGDGAGGLLAPVDGTPGFNVGDFALELADIDGDTQLDVVTSGAWMHGDGTGGFGPFVALGLPTGSGYATGDLNGDTDLDIVQVDNGSAGSVRVVLSNGAGGFAPPVSYPSGITHPIQVEIADLDGDGKLDVATACMGTSGSSGIVVRHGDGLGGLAAPLTLLVGGSGNQTSDVAIADLDVEGRVDLVACNTGSDSVSAFLQTDGTFALAAPVSHPSLKNSSAVATADLDGDGDRDAVVSRASVGASETTLVRWLGDGAGGLASPTEFSVGGAQEDIALGDLNGDGRADAVAVLPLLDRVAVLLNDGAGGLLPVTLYPTGDRPVSLALGDANGDGRLDVLTANELSHDVSLLLGDGAGALAAPLHRFVGGLEPDAIVVDDLDDDGDLDLVTANRMSHGLSVLLGNGAGGFAALPGLPVSDAPEALALGDLDGDGHADLVAACTGPGSGPTAGTLSIRLSLGGGGFGAAQTLPADGNASSIALGDLNGDGRPDLAVGHAGDARLTVFLGRGDGTFAPPLTQSMPLISDIALADMSGHQRLDLLCSQRSSTGSLALSLLVNTSTPHVWRDLGHALAGTFGEPRLVGLGTLQSGSPGSLSLDDAYPSHLGVLFVGPSGTPTPFKGGVLVPVPPLLSQIVFTQPDGRLVLHWTAWTPGVPGSSWYFQYAIVDRAGPANVSLSNALRALQP